LTPAAPSSKTLVGSKEALIGEGISIIFFASVIAVANGFHVPLLVFPELGALASDVLVRPAGKWAREPLKLVCTPFFAAILGVAVSSQLPYGAVAILLAMSLCVGLVYVLRSSVAPAISAGVLPIVFGIRSWQYPAYICGALVVLTAILLLWRRSTFGRALTPNRDQDQQATDRLETFSQGKGWLPALFLFVLALSVAAQWSGFRLILFPPLIVMAYEMFGHPETCPWAKAPYTFPIACGLSACVGVAAVDTLGKTPYSAALALAITFGILRLFRLRMPPALAIGLIPFLLSNPSFRFPVSVLAGSLSLMVWFLGFRRFTPRTPVSTI
jgi:CBS-domain-containing membrane protein